MIEYAITQGEGTLLAYGVADAVSIWDGVGIAVKGDLLGSWDVYQDAIVIACPCGNDCETGE
jgi:hypothetical protein